MSVYLFLFERRKISFLRKIGKVKKKLFESTNIFLARNYINRNYINRFPDIV